MNTQVLFLLSAIGGLNGIFLSLYFALALKNRSKTTYFLAALILTISVRITKSAFLYFNGPMRIIWFVQFGLIACALIGPFLYLYVRESIQKTKTSKYGWLLHVIPYILLMVVLFLVYPYTESRAVWNKIVRWGVYTQWFVYVLVSFWMIKDKALGIFSTTKKLRNGDIWMLNMVLGVGIIWIAYRTTMYTSYIVGALSFSFVFYSSFLLWVLKRKQPLLFFEKDIKYKKKEISNTEAATIAQKLTTALKEDKLYKNSNLKLNDLAKATDTTPHQLSQFLNSKLEKGFNQYVNEFRIEEAKQLLKSNQKFTLEAIGYEAGFSSKSAFYSAFKKNIGQTPAQFRK